MIIDCVSDLHGFYPELKGGDLLIIAGDMTRRGEALEWGRFFVWLMSTSYRCKMLLGGNQDDFLESHLTTEFAKNELGFMPLNINEDFIYLCDSGVEFEGLKIWGSPWSKTFEGMNPKCKAFTCDSEEELTEKFALIPNDIDILVTHTPPYGIMDEVYRVTKWGTKQFNVGSSSLAEKINEIPSLKLHVFGHIHEGYGRNQNPIYVNASHVNEHYEPVNNPIRIEL